MLFSARDPDQADDFPEAWLPYLDANVAVYRRLPEADRARLRRAVPAFVAGKFWEGCAGLTITDEVKVTVAAWACVLALGFEDYHFAEVKTILVYPGGFLSVRDDELGGEEVQRLLGQAMHRGPVVLSWWDVLWDGRRRRHHNVVLHEFAHKLAELGDPHIGMPPLADPALADRWKKVMTAEFEKLGEDSDYGRPTLLDPYGATELPEFFAVATECFFLRPADLRRRHADVYELLSACYRQDPAAWPADETGAARTREDQEEYTRHALAECTAAIRHRPDYADAYRERARLHGDLGEYDKALADCDAVLRLASGDEKVDAYFERGSVRLAAGDYDGAVADFTETIRLDPEHAWAYAERGAAHADAGRSAEALADLTRSLKLDPKDDQVLTWRAAVYEEAGDYNKAIRDLTRAIKLSPHEPTAYVNRAAAHVALKEYEQALADCETAIDLDPDLAEPYKHRGVVRLRRGQVDQALADLNEAIRLAPDYVEAYRARAEAYTKKGDAARARADRAEADRLEKEDSHTER